MLGMFLRQSVVVEKAISKETKTKTEIKMKFKMK
jgi:hypothetical protein